MRAASTAGDVIVLPTIQIGEVVHPTARFKTGAETVSTVSNILGAPSFSPHRIWRLACPFAHSFFRGFAHSQFLSTTGHNATTRIVPMRLSPALLFACLNLTSGLASALSLNTVCLETKLGALVKGFQGSFVVAVLIADSKASDHDRAALIAKVARAVGECSE